MNKKTLYCALIILALWPITSIAICPDPNTMTTIPKLAGVEVKAAITFDPMTGIYSYLYSLKNGGESTGCIWRFEIDIKKPEGGIDLRKEGLINAPRFADLDAPDESSPPMIPVTFPSLPKIDNNIIWGSGVTVDGLARWNSRRYIYDIMPSTTLTGLSMTTYGLPTIQDFKVHTKYIAEKEDILRMGISEKEFILNAWKYLNAFYENIAWKGKTIGPTAPPADFKPFEFLNYIINLKHEAYSLGWITNKGIEQSLDVKLENAKKKLEAGDIKTAKNILNAFLNEVEAQKDKHLTSEAYGLLKYNTQYIVERL